MKTPFFFTLFLIAGILPACTVLAKVPVNPDYTMIFRGQTQYDIIMQIGVPDNEEIDGRGGIIYEYKNWAKLQSKTEFFKQLQSSNDVNVSYVRNIAFFFDKEDSCYLVTTEATELQQQYSRKRTTMLITGLAVGITAHITLAVLMTLGISIPTAYLFLLP